MISKTTIDKALSVALLLLALTGVSWADSAALELRGVVTAGGGTIATGDYTLIGAIGQPVAGALQGGEFSLSSGVIAGGTGAESTTRVFLPLLRR